MPKKGTRVTFIHQWVTIIGIPLGLMLLGWAATQADQMRFDVHDLQNHVGWIEQSVSRHTTELDQINKRLGIAQ